MFLILIIPKRSFGKIISYFKNQGELLHLLDKFLRKFLPKFEKMSFFSYFNDKNIQQNFPEGISLFSKL